MLLRRATAVPFLMLLLSGCVVGPDYTAPETDLPGKFSEGSDESVGNVTEVAWWESFNDSLLTSYVEQGLSQNLSILQALERINQAESDVVINTAGAFPSVSLQGSDTGAGAAGDGASAQQRKTSNTVSGSIPVSWYLDLFGLYRRAGEASEAQLDAAYASADVARLTLISNLTDAYIGARLYQERLQIARSNLQSRRETLRLTQFQLDAGAASRLDVVQSEGLVNAQLSTIPTLEAQYRQQVYALSTLMGLPAPALIDQMNKKKPIPVTHAKLSSGVPADLIRNRPDIRQAERQLAAATARIGVAEAQLYPSITLSGTLQASYSATSIANGGMTSWSFGPGLNLPIFDGGELRANLSKSESVAREAYLTWKQTVLNAVQEVENALAVATRDGRTVAALRASVSSYREALRLSTASYKDGAISLLDVLDAQRSVSDAEASLANAVADQASDFVALNVAIGGGYAVQ
ncbi:efflux transporter outer membrane subunit [Martelella mediterranea]|uniref:Multidrug efflux system outer membrane protein n=1 Tax=Martelella mediterranea TaxID=293089 RepID=A0A4R3NW85_9HYPH|nr:efflux transporter outer membrane subunit [Martelella mediterranea]TCT41746.1 multidrug efflux system outer membrane protein [Martelella mediterranea]